MALTETRISLGPGGGVSRFWIVSGLPFFKSTAALCVDILLISDLVSPECLAVRMGETG